MEWKKILVFGTFIFLFYPQIVHSQAPSPGAGVLVTLSEVSGCEENEWVEVYNSSETNIDLTGWKVEKKGDGSESWSSKALSSETATISAKVYKRFSVGTGFLSNAGFSLRLKDANGDVLEENTFEKCPTASSSSWIKQTNSWLLTTTTTPDAANTLTAIPTIAPSPSPTPKATATPTPTSTTTPSATAQPTTSPTPATQPTTVKLSEVYACQEDGLKEWVELSNSGSSAVTLTNWKLIDADSNEQPIASLTIPAKGYSVVEITKYPKGMLTNTGDTVKLLNGVGATVDTMTYASCSQVTSQSFNGSQWSDGEISKGVANPAIIENTPAPTPQEELQNTTTVLGTSIDEESETPLPTTSPTKQSSSNLIAFGALGTGITMLAGTLGYFGYDYWKKGKGVVKAKHA